MTTTTDQLRRISRTDIGVPRTGEPPASATQGGGPVRAHAIQGGLRDAWLIAVLGAVAGHRPEAIKNILRRDLRAGTANVRFHEARIDPITTDWVPTGRRLTLSVEDELTPLPYAGQHNTAYADTHYAGTRWPALLEKAFAVLDTTWSRTRRLTIPDRGYTRLDQEPSPYDIAEALTHLTGVRSGPLHLQTETAEITLRYLLAQRRPVILTTREPNDPTAISVHGAFPGHAYEITAINQNQMLRLHNPWGVLHVANLTFTGLFDLTGGIVITLKD